MGRSLWALAPKQLLVYAAVTSLIAAAAKLIYYRGGLTAILMAVARFVHSIPLPAHVVG
jgi:hypothetical protein